MITITDEMVDLAIRADTDNLREKYPNPARWPDDFEDEIKEELREWMRAALLAVAPLIAAAEREECAKIAKEWHRRHGTMNLHPADEIAAAIRARNTL